MKIGAQLYTLRAFTQNAADFDAAMKKVAAMGYRYVQVSGIGPIPAGEVADICKKHGLEIVITHTPQARVKDETAGVIEDHRIMGAKLIGIGMMPGDYERTAAGVQKFIADYAPAIEAISQAGMTFMYHNHAFEFERYENKLVMDYLIEGWPKAGFTLDTYWVQAGGGDPAAWIRRLKGRVPAIHVKDMSIVADKQRMEVVGAGNLNWPAIFDACKEAGVEYALVEQDDCYGADPFECLAASFKYLTEVL